MMSLPASLRDLQNLSPQQWLERASQTLPQIVSVVLVIAIAWQLVQLTWLLLDRASGGERAATIVTPTPSANQPRRGIDIQTIVNAHLFGVPKVETKASEDAPQTQMNLVLSAVFAADDPSKGLAIIGESAQSAKVYAVGTVVRPGTRLHEVYFDRVILDRGGQLEALLLPKQNTAGLKINRAPTTPAGATQFADNLRRIAESNPSAFAEIVRPQPVFASGVQRGYRVYPGRNRQQFAKLGLQPGDLVLSINGTPLDDPQRGMEIFNTMGSSDHVTVTIERSGQTQELTLNTAQISLPENAPRASERPKAQRSAAPAFTPTPPEQ
jgi:general secretion pathway protein C